MKQTQGLKSRLEFLQRLGIKYVSSGVQALGISPLEKTPVESPGSETAPHFQPEQPRGELAPDSSLETTNSSSGKNNWLKGAAETIPAMELLAFYEDIHECQKCPLGKTRKSFVFGSGNPQAQVMFVGEAPGADEDEQGLPFVGKAGQLLTKIIESTKTWKREDVFICNVLKCRPPGNRTPQPEEMDQCRPYLEEQINVIKPKLIMALGAVAAQALLKTKEPVGKLRNQWHDLQGIPLRVTYHPAFLLRDESRKKDVWEDMKEFDKRFRETTKA